MSETKDINESKTLASTEDTSISISRADEMKSPSERVQCRVYSRRWVILTLFVFYSTFNAFQWIQYAIINNVVVEYYGVTADLVNWTSMIYMVLYIPLIVPASWFLDKKGLRMAVLMGSLGTMLGAWIKVGSLSPDGFTVAFAGQTVAAASQIFILGIPPKLAAVWFGPDQVSSACSIGVFGNQLGCALGFLVPSWIVKYSQVKSEVTNSFAILYYGQAVINTVIFILVVLLFKDQPELPPSHAQAALRASSGEGQNAPTRSYLNSFKRLLCNIHYDILLITYGMNVGVFYAISTLLNQVVLHYFPTSGEDAGRIGLVIVLAGMLGSVVSGIWLDKTHKFKETTLTVYALSVVGMIVYAFTLPLGHIVVVYVTAALLGFFMTGYLPLGFELAAEITYPEPEGTSAGLLNASAQFFGIIFVIIGSKILESYGDKASNLTLAAMLFVGTILTATIRAELRRQNAIETHRAAANASNKETQLVDNTVTS